jgi:glycosyltransferase involved in cell wall biosynthesis
MKNILFHSNQLCIRGTEVAMYDYAHYNETLLSNKSYIVSRRGSDLGALKKFEDRFWVHLYDEFSEIEEIIKKLQIDYTYLIKAGDMDGRVTLGSKNLIHAVFQHYNPHGDKYFYVSKWLSEKMTNNSENYVPHIVTLPECKNSNLRKKLNISEEATVIGRYGGLDEFDIEASKRAVFDVCKKRKNIYFVFMNTREFCKHDQIIFINPTYNLQNKSDYINMCDGMIHARQFGESFGLAIAEFLFFNKPVISCRQGIDTAHLDMLGDKGLWYSSYQECFDILLNFDKQYHKTINYKELVSEFTPENVMKRFNNLFLS